MTAEPAALFARLVAAADRDWRAYIRHPFVLLLASGELPEACFRRYLVQDYLFLIHFARAWGLAIYKSDALVEMRRAQRLVAVTLDVEIGLHVDYCRGWGLSEAAMAGEPEALEKPLPIPALCSTAVSPATGSTSKWRSHRALSVMP